MQVLSKTLLILFTSLLIGCSTVQPPQGLTGEVQRVISGQTIEVKLTGSSDHSLTQVRLIGIVAPDLKQDPWGVAAKKQLTSLLGKSSLVLLELDENQSDQYGRKLAFVWYQDQLINQKLVEQGYVLAETKFDHQYRQNLIQAQEYARLMGLGIWDPQIPMTLTPQEFRSKNPNRP
jgi:micrococcal nuclease